MTPPPPKTTRTLTAKDKFLVACRDDFTCQYCGSVPGNDGLEIEHLIPVSQHGSDNSENLVAACVKCNRGKSDLVVFPSALCEGPDEIDATWTVHKSFGGWQIKFHPADGAVLEFTRYGYWIGANRAHEPDWEGHINSKGWELPHKDEDLIEAIAYFRRMTRN